MQREEKPALIPLPVSAKGSRLGENITSRKKPSIAYFLTSNGQGQFYGCMSATDGRNPPMVLEDPCLTAGTLSFPPLRTVLGKKNTHHWYPVMTSACSKLTGTHRLSSPTEPTSHLATPETGNTFYWQHHEIQ